MATDPASVRARRRLREEMERLHLNQTDVAGRLQWGQSRVSKLLNGRMDLAVDDLDALCFALGLRLTEAVRDHGLEFCAEMTPSELRFLQAFRTFTPEQQEVLRTILDVRIRSRSEARGATKPKPSIKKIR